MVTLPAPTLREWPAWLAARLASRGVDATPEAVAVLAGRVEGNLLAAAQEIDKLAIVHKGGRLDAADLKALVVDSSRYDVFKLTDAAFGADATRAIHIMEGLEAEGDDLPALMGWLVAQLELAARLASAPDFAAQARAEHLWPTRQQLFASALRRAPTRHWRECLVRAARIDRMIKGREAGNPWREAQRLVVAMARPPRSRAGA